MCKLSDPLPLSSSNKENTSKETASTTNAEERPRQAEARQQKHTLLVDKETTTSTLRSKRLYTWSRKASDNQQQDPVEILQT